MPIQSVYPSPPKKIKIQTKVCVPFLLGNMSKMKFMFIYQFKISKLKFSTVLLIQKLVLYVGKK